MSGGAPGAQGGLKAACDSLAAAPGVRFAGAVDRMGDLAAGSFRRGVRSHLDDKDDRTAYMQFAMEIFLGEQFDESLGAVEHVVTRRKKVTVICLPVGAHVILVSAEPDADVGGTIEAARRAFGGVA